MLRTAACFISQQISQMKKRKDNLASEKIDWKKRKDDSEKIDSKKRKDDLASEKIDSAKKKNKALPTQMVATSAGHDEGKGNQLATSERKEEKKVHSAPKAAPNAGQAHQVRQGAKSEESSVSGKKSLGVAPKKTQAAAQEIDDIFGTAKKKKKDAVVDPPTQKSGSL